MTPKELGKFILIIFALAELIAFLGSMLTYFIILNGIQNDPMNPQNMLNFGNWLVEFLKGQLYGWPISFIITTVGHLLQGNRPSIL